MATYDVLNLAAHDLARTRAFLEEGIGCTAGDRPGLLRFGDTGLSVRLTDWEKLADHGADVSMGGFRGFTISYITATADEIDTVVERCRAAGGQVLKELKNGLWGYSGYLVDPDGAFWKFASSKRRPLLGGHREAPASVRPQAITVTLGVSDLATSREFYVAGMGCVVKKKYPKFVSFDGGVAGPDFAMYRWNDLAVDASVPADPRGVRGLRLERTLADIGEVNQAVSQAHLNGGRVLVDPAPTGSGEYSGIIQDINGFSWTLSTAAA